MDEVRLIPEGWTISKLGDILEPSKDRADPLKIGKVTYIGLEHIDKGTGNLLDFGSSSEVKSTKSVFHEGDLLYGKLRPYLNKVYLARFDGICSTDILVFPKQELVSNTFLFYRMLSGDFVRYTSGNVSGVQHPRVNVNTISQFDVLLPPINEQHRIVAKIEELFTNLDAGVEYLKTVQAQIKRYRQAVLKYAFEGKLTAGWREVHKNELEPASVLLERIREERKKKLGGKYKESPAVDTSDLPELPDGWEWATLADIGHAVTGNTPSKSNTSYYGGDHPFYKPTDLNAGYSVKSSTDGLTDEGINHARVAPEESTLVTCIGATIGKTGYVREAGAFNQQINAIIPETSLIPEFIYFMCISPNLQKKIINNASSTTLPILNKGRFSILPFPLPSTEEQKRIVEDIERRFSIADEIEKVLERSVWQSDRLRQSVLKKAFEGKLVPQDPNDEPADKLLERIKEERAKLAAESKKAKSKKGS